MSASAARLLESVLDEERAELESREEIDMSLFGAFTPSAVPVASGGEASERFTKETAAQTALSSVDAVSTGTALEEAGEVATEVGVEGAPITSSVSTKHASFDSTPSAINTATGIERVDVITTGDRVHGDSSASNHLVNMNPSTVFGAEEDAVSATLITS